MCAPILPSRQSRMPCLVEWCMALAEAEGEDIVFCQYGVGDTLSSHVMNAVCERLHTVWPVAADGFPKGM